MTGAEMVPGAVPGTVPRCSAGRRAPTAAELAADCRECGARLEPARIAWSGAAFASAGYECGCGRQWVQRWADDETPEGAAALAAADERRAP
jgi:hypothetical protein